MRKKTQATQVCLVGRTSHNGTPSLIHSLSSLLLHPTPPPKACSQNGMAALKIFLLLLIRPQANIVCVALKKEVPPSQPSQEDNARSGISVFQEVYAAAGIKKCR